MTDRNTIHCGDCRDWLKTLPDNSVDACVTDPLLACDKSPEYVAIATARLKGRNGPLFCEVTDAAD